MARGAHAPRARGGGARSPGVDARTSRLARSCGSPAPTSGRRRARSSASPRVPATWSRRGRSPARGPLSRWRAAPAVSWRGCAGAWRHERPVRSSPRARHLRSRSAALNRHRRTGSRGTARLAGAAADGVHGACGLRCRALGAARPGRAGRAHPARSPHRARRRRGACAAGAPAAGAPASRRVGARRARRRRDPAARPDGGRPAGTAPASRALERACRRPRPRPRRRPGRRVALRRARPLDPADDSARRAAPAGYCGHARLLARAPRRAGPAGARDS